MINGTSIKVEKILKGSLDFIQSPSVKFQNFVDDPKQCFAFTHQANFPTHNMNFHSRWWWWDRIQDVSLNLFYFKVDDDEAMVSTPNVKSLALKKSERKMWVQIKATSDAIEINMDEDRPASFESKDQGLDFVFWICLQSSQILSRKRNWHKNDK